MTSPGGPWGGPQPPQNENAVGSRPPRDSPYLTPRRNSPRGRLWAGLELLLAAALVVGANVVPEVAG